VLRSLILYGGNASGKSNVCRAFHAMRSLVLESTTKSNQGGRIPGIDPFAFRRSTREAPPGIELTVLISGAVYRYGFITSPLAIEAEWLYRKEDAPRKRSQLIFQRRGPDPQDWSFGEAISKATQGVLRDRTRPDNCLLLSKGAQENVPAALPV